MTAPPRRWSAEDQEVALETIERTGVNLTVWEESFVESLRTQVNAHRPLSDKQVEILERIYAQRTP